MHDGRQNVSQTKVEQVNPKQDATNKKDAIVVCNRRGKLSSGVFESQKRNPKRTPK